MRLGDLSRLLASLVLVVGIVLSPLRAMAATIPAFIPYDASIRSTATTPLGRHDAVQPETERVRTACDDAAFASHDPSNRPAAAGVRGGLAYDDALNLAERRELTEGAIYAAPPPQRELLPRASQQSKGIFPALKLWITRRMPPCWTG